MDIAVGCFVLKLRTCEHLAQQFDPLHIAFAHADRTHTLILTVLLGRNHAFLTSAYNLSL